jgi:hypothetical protein
MPTHEWGIVMRTFTLVEAKSRWETDTTIMASNGKTSEEEHTNRRHEQRILYLA